MPPSLRSGGNEAPGRDYGSYEYPLVLNMFYIRQQRSVQFIILVLM
jgi:hypothetical protein